MPEKTAADVNSELKAKKEELDKHKSLLDSKETSELKGKKDALKNFQEMLEQNKDNPVKKAEIEVLIKTCEEDIKKYEDSAGITAIKEKIKELEGQIIALEEQVKTAPVTKDTENKKEEKTEEKKKEKKEEDTVSRPVGDYDKKKNAEMAVQHPERVVDGIYYEDDEALAQAKAASEKKIKEETEKAIADATARANKLAAAMKTINETLYGTDNQEVIQQLQGTVGGAELSSILGNAVSVRARQHLLDFNKFKSDFKEPNSGKPPHNKDPFPVDSKIEEFETHLPRVKINQIVTHIHGKAPAIAAVQQFDMTEKRLVRLENNISTLMRYVFRLGARVFINCQFYGGQTTFEKGYV